jgi:hypothetical protein
VRINVNSKRKLFAKKQVFIKNVFKKRLIKTGEDQGKKPFPPDKFDKEESKEIKESTTDPESGYYVKDERTKQFVYSFHAAADRNGFVLGMIVTVQLVGTNHLLTRLAIPFDINDPSWNGNLNVDNRSGFADLSLLTGLLDFDFTTNTITPSTGRLFFVSVNISSTLDFTGNTTIEYLDDATGLGYTPTNSANWDDPDPTTVQEALDRIAALIGPIPL